MEENILAGGFGSGVMEALMDEGHTNRVLRFGIPDTFVPHGDAAVLKDELGLTPEKMSDKIAQILKRV